MRPLYLRIIPIRPVHIKVWCCADASAAGGPSAIDQDAVLTGVWLEVAEAGVWLEVAMESSKSNRLAV